MSVCVCIDIGTRYPAAADSDFNGRRKGAIIIITINIMMILSRVI